MTEPADEVWLWSTTEERFTSYATFPTRGVAIAAARAELDEGQPFWTGRKVDPLTHVEVDPAVLLEAIGEHLYEQAGDYADGWPTVAPAGDDPDQDALGDALTSLLRDYLRTHDAPSFFVVEDMERHTA